jgi:transcriptional regulator with XRE-family HTH domain
MGETGHPGGRDEYARIGAVLRARREALRYTQVRLAAEIGVAESTYSRYEAGKQKITIPELKRVAALLALPLEAVVGDGPTTPPPLPDLAHRVADLVADRLPAIVRAVLTESGFPASEDQERAGGHGSPNQQPPELGHAGLPGADYRYLKSGGSGLLGRLVRAAGPSV